MIVDRTLNTDPQRRVFCLSLVIVALGASASGAAEVGPAAVVAAVYRRASAGKGDDGGQFLWLRPRDRRINFTRRTSDLWDRAERATPRGDQGPPGFDPVTASQDPSLTRYALAVEEEGPESARILVQLFGYGDDTKPYASVRYHLAREGGRWLVDDITGRADGPEWSIRDILQQHNDDTAKAAKSAAAAHGRRR